MKKVLKYIGIGFVVLIVIGIISSSGDSSTTKTTTSNGTTETETAEESKTGEWVVVAELSGSANKNSDTFDLKGGKTRVTYTFEGNNPIVGSIYVLKEGTDLQTDGGFPEVMVSEASTDSTIIRKSAGEYYLSVSVANADYTVTVEEQR